ncbi:MAG TPA: M20/M25/M40 family metallo-hydrolase [Planctomycetes bacterium]|nr:M20/M25/M40 family metallo-hydrolase [Planctomycetota bacterium]
MPQSTNPAIDSKLALQHVMKLMAIAGKSGQESQAADYVTQALLKAGAAPASIESDAAHRRSPNGGECGNLVIKLPGTVRAPRRMLSAHLDTVPICVGSEPRRKGQLVRSANPATGLGADNRAGTAVLLSTALHLLRHQLPHPPLTFCWFVQEETGLLGARHVSKGLLGNPKLAFNWDGGGATKLTIGATGGYRLRIEIDGLASHAGGAPEKGISAISIAALAIADLQQNGWHGLIRKGNHEGTSNVGFIEGGEATNVVTDHVAIRAEARSHHPGFRKRIVTQIEKAFQKAVKQVKSSEGKTGQVRIESRLDYESFRLSTREPCIQAAQDAVQSLGHQAVLAIANGGLDANWTTRHGIPTVSLGCGQANAHTVSESLDIREYQLACQIALQLATQIEN